MDLLTGPMDTDFYGNGSLFSLASLPRGLGQTALFLLLIIYDGLQFVDGGVFMGMHVIVVYNG